MDVLDGGDGPDYLHSRDLTWESIVGGEGFDVAERDAYDPATGVELFL